MALQPPKDFRPGTLGRPRPSLGELWEVWERRRAREAEAERFGRWRESVDLVRRGQAGELLLGREDEDAFGGFLRGGDALGCDARGGLRRAPRSGRVVGAGVDTWSPCWYVESGSRVSRAMSGLATLTTGRAALIPGRVGGYRVGWFPEWGLVFGEGRPGKEGLCGSEGLVEGLVGLAAAMEDVGVPIGEAVPGGVRRLDVAVDLWTGSGMEGLGFLECLGSAAVGGKVATYRGGRRVESVLLKSGRGRSQGRVYDKGQESGRAPAGRWLRLEAQWRFQQGSRPSVEGLSGSALRERFRSRFEVLWQAAEGYRVGGMDLVVERVRRAVERGQLRPSRARSVVGYLVLESAGVKGGARRTECELERECRQLGLSVSLLGGRESRVDVARVLEECLAGEVWGLE
jgi:hypothetical protein